MPARGGDGSVSTARAGTTAPNITLYSARMDELATVEGTFVVEHPLGLHAVLAVKLATVAQGFRSDIGFRVGGRLADVKARRT
jgi:hypothetical protein